MTRQLLDRSQSKAPLERGDKLLWLYRESDSKFGEAIEVIKVTGEKVDYHFPDHPTWKTCLSPVEMILPRKPYTLEDISRIKQSEKKTRRRVNSIFAILLLVVAVAQWSTIGSIRQVIREKAKIENEQKNQ
jgi:hypothetical protein